MGMRRFLLYHSYPALCPEQSRVQGLPRNCSSVTFFLVTNSRDRISYLFFGNAGMASAPDIYVRYRCQEPLRPGTQLGTVFPALVLVPTM